MTTAPIVDSYCRLHPPINRLCPSLGITIRSSPIKRTPVQHIPVIHKLLPYLPNHNPRNNHRTAAILKWKRKSGRCNEILDKLNMIHNVYEFKKLYRQEAILRWKEKKVNAFKKQNKEAKDKKQHNSSTGNDDVTNIASTSTYTSST
ncbi:hypothetical protein LXL04_003729 [Taraxacum kok-saghyz]